MYTDVIIIAIIAVVLIGFLIYKLGRNKNQRLEKQWNHFIEKKIKGMKHTKNNPAQHNLNPHAVPDESNTTITTVIPLVGDGPVYDTLRQYQQKNPSFSLQEYLLYVEEIYEKVTEIFAGNDYNLLAPYMIQQVYDKLSDIMKKRSEKSLTKYHLLLGFNNVSVKNVILNDTDISVEVSFTTEQINALMDKNEKIISGNNSNTKIYEEQWTFKKDISNTSPQQIDVGYWKIVHMN